MSRRAHSQRGVTLLISLIMLTILTLFATAMIRLSSTNMLIAGNMAVQHALRDAVQQTIETDLNSATFFTDAAGPAGTWATCTTWPKNCTKGYTYNGYSITLNMPVCLTWQPAKGDQASYYGSITNSTNQADTYWEVSATGTDSATGATVTLTQGVKITTASTNCNGGA